MAVGGCNGRQGLAELHRGGQHLTEHAELAAKIAGLAFVTTSMASAGLVVMPRDVLAHLRRWRFVLTALVVNFALAPLVAWLICRVIPIDAAYAAGLVLISGAAGAPLFPKLAQIAGGDRAEAITLMLLLLVGTVIFLPLAMPLLIPDLRADPRQIARPLVLLILLPLGAGMALRSLLPAAAARLEPALRHISDLALILFVVLVIATHIPALRGALGSGAILAALLFILGSGAVAYALGGPRPAGRRVLALSTAQRNVAAALVTAGHSFADEPKVIVMVLVADIVAIAVLFTAAWRFRRAAAAEAHAASAGAAHA